jgi:outer membrane scaffolding protein for murein synthesis (MipA/OmpV family)
MSNEVMPYIGSDLAMRDGRRVGRAISRNRGGALIRISATDADADVAQAKIDNLTMATGTAMSSVVRVAEAQRHLEQLAPEAAARLAYLADDHMLGMGEVLADLRRDMRRR